MNFTEGKIHPERSHRVHAPVLVSEILNIFSPQEGDVLLDATLGHGGHAKAFLQTEGTSVIGIEADGAALAVAKEELATFASRITTIHGSYVALKEAVVGKRITHVLFDLGIGSHQLADEERGFSFTSSGRLTMQYGSVQQLPPSDIQAINWLEGQLGYPPDAIDLLIGLKEQELADVIWRYGEERLSRRIAKAIKQRAASIGSAKELADVITQAVSRSYEHGRIHPATRTFQALRLAVNRELESLKVALPQAVEILSGGSLPADRQGRLAVISFHSLEDRIVKQFLRSAPHLHLLTKKPIEASEEERKQNPRSRSAKLRAAEKI